MPETPRPLLLSVWLDDDEAGLDRIVSLLRRRRVSIDSLTLQRGVVPGTTWLSLGLGAGRLSPRRICAELRKLIAVRDVQSLDPVPRLGGRAMPAGLAMPPPSTVAAGEAGESQPSV